MVNHEIGGFFAFGETRQAFGKKKGKKGENPTVKRLKGISSFLGIEQHTGRPICCSMYEIMYKLL